MVLAIESVAICLSGQPGGGWQVKTVGELVNAFCDASLAAPDGISIEQFIEDFFQDETSERKAWLVRRGSDVRPELFPPHHSLTVRSQMVSQRRAATKTLKDRPR
jgi:hypothetical protein